MIVQILEQEKEGLEQFTSTDGYDYNGGSNVLKVLGYFSMVGLLRVHCLLGDYHTGLKCLQPIDISQQGVYTSVIGSHITTIYHYGFANLMLRRYVYPVFCFIFSFITILILNVCCYCLSKDAILSSILCDFSIHSLSFVILLLIIIDYLVIKVNLWIPTSVFYWVYISCGWMSYFPNSKVLVLTMI